MLGAGFAKICEGGEAVLLVEADVALDGALTVSRMV